MPDPNKRYRQLIDDIRAEFPRFRIVRKDRSPLSRAIHVALLAVTAGQMRAYLSGYQTTIAQTVYVTPDWDDRPADERYLAIRHERVHLRQFRRWSFLGMALAYLLLPLPMGLALCRARFEWEAYAESIRAAAELYGPAHVRSPRFRDGILRQFTGANYGWMWPFPRQLERWYDRELELLGAL